MRRVTSLAFYPLVAALELLTGCGNEQGPLKLQSAAVAVLTVTDSPVYDFGAQPVDAIVDKTFTVTNTGLKPATSITSSFNLSLNFSYAGGAYPGLGGTCGAELAVGDHCSLVVRFQPKYVGAFDDAVQIHFHNGMNFQTSSAPTLKAKAVWETPGTVDRTLSPTGAILTSQSSDNDGARAVATQPDGKILSVGSARIDGTSVFGLMRYLSDGTLDTSFGTDGIVTIAGSLGDSAASSVAVQFDGKIVVAGRATVGANSAFAVMRLHSDGSPDLGFGAQGVALASAPAGDLWAQSVVVLPDRRIVLAGTSSSGTDRNVVLARFESDGVLDATFGLAGLVATSLGAGEEEAFGMELVNGKLVVVGSSAQGADSDFLVLRFSTEGELDTTFGVGGIVQVDGGDGSADVGRAIKAQPDGKLLIAGTSTGIKSEMAVLRFFPNGTLDPSFGTGGRALTSLGVSADHAFSLLVQSDKRIVAIGKSGNDLGLIRLTSAGALDLTFGNNGKTVTSFGSGTEAGFGATLLPNGKIVVVGEMSQGLQSDAFLARYWP